MRGPAIVEILGSDTWYEGFVEGFHSHHVEVSNAIESWKDLENVLHQQTVGTVYLPAQFCKIKIISKEK